MSAPTSGIPAISQVRMSRRRMLGLSAAAAVLALAACSDDNDDPQLQTSDPAKPGKQLASDDPAAASFLSGQHSFAWAMLGSVAAAAGGNAVLSSFSIGQALGMVGQGAAGSTLDQIAEAFGCASALDLASGANAQLTSIADKKNAKISVANAAFAADDLKQKEAYEKALADYFGVGAHTAPYAKDPEKARAKINTWVADRTEQKIPELLSPGQVNSDTRIVLVNAIYLLANWDRQFTPERTSDGTFYADNGEVNVDMMRDDRSVEYAEQDGTIVVRLPYEDDDLAAYLVMPPKGELDDFLTSSSGDELEQLLSAVEEREGELQVPRFEIRQRIELSKVLADHGIVDAFTDAADFSAMSDEPTYLSFVQHEAWIKVGEKGTEAAAATAAGIEAGAAPVEDPVEAYFDHPFLFIVRDDTTKTALFSAVVRDPSS